MKIYKISETRILVDGKLYRKVESGQKINKNAVMQYCGGIYSKLAHPEETAGKTPEEFDRRRVFFNPVHKTVMMEVDVVDGYYCWEYSGDCHCEHFDNEGGHPTCDLGFRQTFKDGRGIVKPVKCQKLADK